MKIYERSKCFKSTANGKDIFRSDFAVRNLVNLIKTLLNFEHLLVGQTSVD